MVEVILFLTTIAVIVAAIERNHIRRGLPPERFGGPIGADDRDRDIVRVSANLAAVREACRGC